MQRTQAIQVRLGIAAGVVVVASAWAAETVRETPAPGGSNTTQIRQIAERLGQEAPSDQPLALSMPAKSATDVAVVARPRPVVKPAPAPAKSKPVAKAPETKTVSSAAELVKSIALIGVTVQGSSENAWLVDLQTKDRQVVGEGDEAFGFKVKNIEPDSVVLENGSDEFSLHLGEKEVPPLNPPEETDTTTVASNDAFGGWGGGWGGRGGRGGRGWRRGGWNGGGGSTGSSYSRPYTGKSLYTNGLRGRPSYNYGGGYGGGFGGYNSRNNVSLSALHPTSNPQAARRQGVSLVGGGTPLPTPPTVSNPQTLRRLGTNSGVAFGDNSYNSGSSSRTKSNSRNGR